MTEVKQVSFPKAGDGQLVWCIATSKSLPEHNGTLHHFDVPVLYTGSFIEWVHKIYVTTHFTAQQYSSNLVANHFMAKF